MVLRAPWGLAVVVPGTWPPLRWAKITVDSVKLLVLKAFDGPIAARNGTLDFVGRQAAHNATFAQ